MYMILRLLLCSYRPIWAWQWQLQPAILIMHHLHSDIIGWR